MMRFAAPSLALLCLLVLFTALDRPGFLDEHEARDASVARDCIRHHEVLTPQSGSDPVFEKPMLAYAPEIVARSLSRDTAARNAPLRSRQVRALGALALVLLTGSMAYHRFGVRAGWCSAIALVTSLGVPLAARTDGTQVFATLLAWCAAAVLSRAALDPKPVRDGVIAFAYAALAAALLVGGPLSAAWVPGGIALYTRLARDRPAWSRTRPLTGLAIVAGLALPWYGVELYLHGPAWLLRAIWFPYGLDAHGAWFSGPLIALSVLVLACFPWSVLMPEAMRLATSELESGAATPGARAGAARAAYLSIALLGCAIVPVALHPGVPLSAALPALPAAAMLCGRFLDRVFDEPDALRDAVARAARTLALLGTGGALLLAVAAGRVPEAASDVRLLAATAFLTAWLPLLAVWRSNPRAAAALIALPIAVGAPLTSLFVLPALEGYLTTRTVAAAMNDRSPQDAPLAVFSAPPPSLKFYAHRNVVRTEPDSTALAAWRAEDGFTYAAFAPGLESDVRRRAGAPLEVLWRTPAWMLARVPVRAPGAVRTPPP